jgi:NAD(P)-dependent dehydrogenase (short-subunit alcohol dehydrogenase family)
VALVTGADSGIGRAVALAFAREGADQRVVEEAGRKAILLAADLADPNACKRIVDETVRAFGRIDVGQAATKRAIVTFTKGLAEEVVGRGIRADVVAPGPVWTPLIVQSFDEEKVKKFGEGSPMERPAQPAELAPAYVFLASDESRYVNGEVLGVTGGKPLA